MGKDGRASAGARKTGIVSAYGRRTADGKQRLRLDIVSDQDHDFE